MSLDLILHGRPVSSVFELLGTKENDITYSVGWALSKCPDLLQALLAEVFAGVKDFAVEGIELQRHGDDSGFTDIEIRGPELHVIIEAKRGWCLPSAAQWLRYHPRFDQNCRHRAFVAMSECSPEYAKLQLKDVNGMRITHIGWRDLQTMTRRCGGNNAEKRLLEELRVYLERIVKIQDQESNMVFLVSLSDDTPEWSTLSWKQMVDERSRYFHPVGIKGWPKHPPNYIGYHYKGQLWTIHHVESWKIIRDMRPEMPELNREPWDEDLFLYTLGPAIRPSKPVKRGKIHPQARLKVMLDLLLTCDSISDALEKTKQRLTDE